LVYVNEFFMFLAEKYARAMAIKNSQTQRRAVYGADGGGYGCSCPVSASKYIPSMPDTLSGTLCNMVHLALLIFTRCLI
jgi:hypothetical protein